jgi:four helix bundle protein
MAASRGPIRSYRDLEVYQRARVAIVSAHKLALNFPDYERYDLAAQMRSCSKSGKNNIAEGHSKRSSAAEFKRFLRMALGSCGEMESHIETAEDLGYMSHAEAVALLDEYQIIGRQLTRLIENWRTIERPASSLQPPASRRNGAARSEAS